MKPKDFEEVVNGPITKIYEAELDMEKQKTYKLTNGKTTTSLAEKMMDDCGWGIWAKNDKCIRYVKHMTKKASIFFKEIDLGYDIYMEFALKEKTYSVFPNGTYRVKLTLKEHQAITQQLKELGVGVRL